MNNKAGKTGFTLVEILVAMAIIVTIVSMVYGSYFAMSRSTQACKARIALLQQGREILTQMAGQIRCSYASSAEERLSYLPKSTSSQVKTIPENTVNYFNGNTDDQSGEILHLITTSGFFYKQEPASGLFEVTYKFDKSTGLLSLSQERFTAAPKNVLEKRIWQPIAESIRCVELAFFDGQQWLPKWDFKDKGELPYAVKITISGENKNYQRYHYGTIAFICCRNNRSEKVQSDMLVSVNKQ
jgi:type II secretion system protein J